MEFYRKKRLFSRFRLVLGQLTHRANGSFGTTWIALFNHLNGLLRRLLRLELNNIYLVKREANEAAIWCALSVANELFLQLLTN